MLRTSDCDVVRVAASRTRQRWMELYCKGRQTIEESSDGP
jgi:hypothetical protein